MYKKKKGFKIVIHNIEEPPGSDIEDEFNWLCKSLGFFEPIDKSRTASCIFRELVKSASYNEPLSSTEISKRVNMSRGSVINHLNKLLRSGLIEKRGSYYFVKGYSVYDTIVGLEEELESMFKKMRRIAKEIDRSFGIHHAK